MHQSLVFVSARRDLSYYLQNEKRKVASLSVSGARQVFALSERNLK